jgi:hypothetical protein
MISDIHEINELIQNGNIALIIETVERSFGVIYPDSPIKVVWDLLGLIFILYQGIFIPFRICFNVTATDGFAALEIAVDMFFLADILVTANCGYYSNGVLIMKRWDIILNYLKLW